MPGNSWSHRGPGSAGSGSSSGMGPSTSADSTVRDSRASTSSLLTIGLPRLVSARRDAAWREDEARMRENQLRIEPMVGTPGERKPARTPDVSTFGRERAGDVGVGAECVSQGVRKKPPKPGAKSGFLLKSLKCQGKVMSVRGTVHRP